MKSSCILYLASCIAISLAVTAPAENIKEYIGHKGFSGQVGGIVQEKFDGSIMFKVLKVLEFNSTRKRMSLVV